MIGGNQFEVAIRLPTPLDAPGLVALQPAVFPKSPMPGGIGFPRASDTRPRYWHPPSSWRRIPINLVFRQSARPPRLSGGSRSMTASGFGSQVSIASESSVHLRSKFWGETRPCKPKPKAFPDRLT